MKYSTRRGLVLAGLTGGGAMLLGRALRTTAIVTPRDFYPPESLVVAAVNVGHGEANWVKTPSGQAIVIGTGPDADASNLVRSLQRAGISRIDLLILPTPYRESLGGVPGLAQAFPISQVFDNGWPRVINASHGAARAILDRQKIPIYSARAGQSFPLDRGELEFLHPADPLVEQSPEAGNNSVVVRLRWAGTTFLWAGGIERSGEESMLHRLDGLSAHWLRVSRFGTKEASSPEWLREVSPEIAVISVGANSSGYPHPETLARIEASGATIYRTDATPEAWVFLSDGIKVTAAG